MTVASSVFGCLTVVPNEDKKSLNARENAVIFLNENDDYNMMLLPKSPFSSNSNIRFILYILLIRL